ncbi:MAG TPA: beta-galactosidase family protein, partial [Hanamia sp.]|nr:beta-galactosidase family protein [Hanamia sp.]
MKKYFLLVFILAAFSTNLIAQSKHTFQIKDGNFLYDGKPIQIHSGEMHFARVPKAYWKQRLQMMKAMGLNTVATYVFWNYHETSPGVWDFKTGNKNIADFIKTAQQVGLFVILRPGPYACAEWEFGGFPWWLQKVPSLELRTYNQPYLDSCKNYIKHLAAQVKNLQITHGGPLIMVQVENEFGSYVSQRKDIPFEMDRKYVQTIKNDLTEAGFDVPFFTSDGSWLFKGGSVEGALPAANGEDNIENLKKVVNEFHNNEGPYMVAEFYPGWLDHWAEPFQKVGVKNVVDQTEKYLKAGVSFNFYMVHGGTNYGFTSGANYDKDHDIQPDITSYDYDAPISEAGWATPKYLALRKLFEQYSKSKLPPIPSPEPVIAIPSIK